MKLIIGLGNPGLKYKKTRHNIGFMFLDTIAKEEGLKFKLDPAKRAKIATWIINGEKNILIKPQTFMNLSGEAVKLIINYYKIDYSDVLIISDDLDLPVGRMRLRKTGSCGGHNGLKNIFKILQTEEIKRLKIGISKTDSEPVVDYVLGKFFKDEYIDILHIMDKASDIVKDFNSMSFENLMSRYNN